MGSEARACAHCGLPVPADLVADDDAPSFCCGGCKAVYAILHDQGLDDTFYSLADGERRLPARVTDKSYAELDEEAVHDLYVETRAGGAKQIELYLEGVHCTACVWLVEKLPALLPGVLEARLDLGRQLATVRWDQDAVPLSRVARKLDGLGYPVHPYRGVDRRKLRRDEDRRLLIRIGVAGAVAGNVMLIAAALYAGLFGDMSAEHRTFFRWASFVVTLPSALWCAAVFYRGAFGALRSGALHMDLPISIGIIAGFFWGTLNTLRGRGDIYFDSVAVLIFLLLIGRWLQQRQQRGAADAAELLYSLTPSSVRVVAGAPQTTSDGKAPEVPLDGGEVHEVPVESLTEGTVVEVRAGETIAVDGTVVAGSSTVDTSLLTGESRGVPISVGEAVHAGTLNVSARLRIRVTATGEATRVGQLMRRIEEHARRRAPIVQLADRVAGYFVATTLVLATLTALLWSWRGDAHLAVEHAIALLIVTCPCALGLATPLAVAVAIGRAARGGILIKGGDVLERLARPGLVFLDKTGTLTVGRQTLLELRGEQELLPLAAALEQQSGHSLAQALSRAVAPELLSGLVADEVRETTGAGIEGLVAGRRIIVGAPSFVRERCSEALAPELEQALAEAVAAAHTPVLVAADGRPAALAIFGDPLRPDAAALLAELERLGFTPSMLSGDHPEVVRAVARQLGMDDARAEGGASPERKLAAIEAAAAKGPVLMVGDGVNDAAALSAATAGIAVHGGAEASLQAADVFMSEPGLHRVIALLRGARATLRTIRGNIIFSLLYNAVGASLAMAGVINPLIAAVLMPLSSLTVVTNSFRSRGFGRESVDKNAPPTSVATG